MSDARSVASQPHPGTLETDSSQRAAGNERQWHLPESIPERETARYH